MAVAIALVALLPIGFVYTLAFAFNAVGAAFFETASGSPLRGPITVDPLVVVAGVALGFAAQYALADRVALRSAGARRVDREARPDLIGRVDRLAQVAGVPTPDVAVSRSDVPNAFAVGVRPSAATIVVTEGLLDALDGEELDAVLAHELSHVKNRDVSVMSMAYFLPTLTYLAAMGALRVLKGLFYVLGSMDDIDGDDAKALLVAAVAITVSAILTMAISALFWVASFALFRILSQYREHAADRGAAAITGNPAALASALRTVDDEMSDLPDRDLRAEDGGLEALYVAPIDTYQFGSDRDLISSDLFPSTHPPTDERIEKLREIAGRTERGVPAQ